MKVKKIICALFLFCAQVNVQESFSNKAQHMEWWTEARFGMFIHWGLYALHTRHEWVEQRANH